ncbi:WLM domain-containing protein [Hirsutella rhossiliensis]|uniref:WLM domain-containing protein n=1 Tax=Hirsutella rhossiliensis TaxID=111463 RepID=A0A9P8N151_9HYPO|nr:WLM domain-containing protein [Hirsutella rhossiliensis]KAH0966248.1 WLM domain-containing protein [Hirsutella rhossiliensis]
MSDAVSLAESSGSESGWMTMTISHRKHNYSFDLPDDATVADLFVEIEAALDIPVSNQKILVPKGPLLKAPFKDANMSLHSLQGKALTLMGSGVAEVQAVKGMAEKVARRNAARIAQRAKTRTTSRKSQARSADDAKYTFLQVQPLQGLPHPERSQALLMRLKEDPGIRAAMRKHKFTVALLTEMEPLSHTQSTHEGTSRILGLNRNQGEVVELRLRTDAHDGYRDYKTIRKTLCHELAHNVHGPHDRHFWDLCHQIEREVDGADWKTSGRTIGETSRYTISGQDDETHEDDGGWTGGEFVLGGGKDQSPGMSRREVLAQAALERQRKEAGAERKACDAAEKGWRPCQRSQQSDGTE